MENGDEGAVFIRTRSGEGEVEVEWEHVCLICWAVVKLTLSGTMPVWDARTAGDAGEISIQSHGDVFWPAIPLPGDRRLSWMVVRGVNWYVWTCACLRLLYFSLPLEYTACCGSRNISEAVPWATHDI